MRTYHNQQGYSLIEVLIALTILMIAIVAPITIAIKSLESSTYSLEQNTAVFLAQEAISIIEGVRNTNALIGLDGGTRIFWSLNGSGVTQSGFGPCVSNYGCNFDATSPYDLLSAAGSPAVACTQSGENCRMYLTESSGVTSPYSLSGTQAEQTPFKRRVFVNYTDLDGNGNVDEMIIRADVEWDSEFLGRTQRVSLWSVIYNVYRF